MHKINFSILFVVASFISFSQVLTGKIMDKDSVEIPFAKVRLLNESYGTVANASGNFQLELKKGKHVMIFSSIGFETKTDTVEIVNLANTLVIVMKENTLELDEITVFAQSKKDKGKELMKEVIKKRPYFQDLLAEYECETYCFSTLEKAKLDSLERDSIIGKDKLNIIEWKAKTSYKRIGKFKDEFYAYNDLADRSSTMTNSTSQVGVSFDFGNADQRIAEEQSLSANPYLFINGIKDAHFSLFDNSISSNKLTQNPLVSPLADNAFMYYSYFLENTFVDSTGAMINEVTVKPKFDYEALFSGTLFIREGSWELVSYELQVNKKVLNYFKDIHIICDYKKVGEHLVPVRREFVYNIKEGKDLINGLIRVSHQDYKFVVDDSPKNFWLASTVYKEDAFEKDSSYWNETRPFTLKDFEKQFIKEQDSIILYHESEEYLKKSDSTRNVINLSAIFLSGISHVNSFKKYEFTILPVISQFTPFGIGGFRYRPGISFQKEFKNSKIITIAPNIDYGFYNKDFKGSFSGSVLYNRMNFSKIGFEIGDVYDFIPGSQNIVGAIAPSSRVRNRKFEAFFSREIVNGLYGKSSVLYSFRESIGNLEYPEWLAIFKQVQPAQLFDPYKIMQVSLDLEYHFRQKYTIRKHKKVVLGSIWPVVFLKYKVAIPTIFDAEANFSYLEFQATHTMKLKSFGNSSFRFVAGQYLYKQDLRLIENKFFRPSDMGFFSNPVNTMQLLDTALHTSNSFIQFNFIHHFNGYFLNKIWLINKLKLEETIGGGLISIPSSNFAQVEFYAGLERKFRIRKQLFKIGLYAVSQNNSFDKSSIQFKFGINFYNSFNDKWEY